MSDFVTRMSDVLARDLEQIKDAAQNSANMNTPGYRSVRHVAQSAFADAALRPQTVVDANFTLTDGAYTATRQATDFALSGSAWFAVQTPDGVLLTRNGRFRLADNGDLLSQQGYRVLGANGPITGLNNDFTINSDGDIRLGTQSIDRLRLLQAEPSTLHSVGNGYYRSDSARTVSGAYMVMQGMYEQSNVNSASEMMRLMETTRHFETVQRAISAYDQVMNSGINELGKN